MKRLKERNKKIFQEGIVAANLEGSGYICDYCGNNELLLLNEPISLQQFYDVQYTICPECTFGSSIYFVKGAIKSEVLSHG